MAVDLRELTEDEKFSLATDALGFGVLDPTDQKLTYEIMESAVRKFCEVNGLTLGVTVVSAPLTDAQILDLLPNLQSGWTLATFGLWVARAIERAHGIGTNGVDACRGGQR